ncbi:tRNA (adenosine(37)-N6)-threonylcarbamoyltransferase complex ATPase subunit type 1 TsaE [Paenibacillus chartarius]|uniref:tRNA threonylcarbamoyladenosine biosynthesis protein TsaE n=1 Tax=Paenibacillus chartarius TaxID=747481 RepID=A0ABV6DKT5_9BACL
MSSVQQQYEYASHGETDTERLAAALGRLAEPGSVLTLEGDLGAGKTRFSQALAKALGVPGVVNSPTFTIIKEYEGRLPLYHMDVYRLTEAEADELGLDEYFFGKGVTLVEWASRIEELLPEERLAVEIAHVEGGGWTERRLTLTPYGERYAAWCRELERDGLLRLDSSGREG